MLMYVGKKKYAGRTPVATTSDVRTLYTSDVIVDVHYMHLDLDMYSELSCDDVRYLRRTSSQLSSEHDKMFYNLGARSINHDCAYHGIRPQLRA